MGEYKALDTLIDLAKVTTSIEGIVKQARTLDSLTDNKKISELEDICRRLILIERKLHKQI